MSYGSQKRRSSVAPKKKRDNDLLDESIVTKQILVIGNIVRHKQSIIYTLLMQQYIREEEDLTRKHDTAERKTVS
jgi:hypothetical protein